MKNIAKIMKTIVATTFFGAFFYIVVVAQAQTATVQELQSKITGKNSDIEQLEEEIRQYQKELSITSKEANTLKGTIKTLDISKRKLDTDIRVTKNKIDSTNYTIQKIAIEIDDSEKRIKNQIQALAKSLSDVNELESNSLLEVILSKETISGFWDDVNSLERVQEAMSVSLQELRGTKLELEGKYTENKEQKNSLENYTDNLADQRSIVKGNITEKDNLLSITKNKESNYKKLVAEKEEQKRTFERELLEIESQLQAVIDPNSIPKAGLGIFAPPLSGISYSSCYDGSTTATNCTTQYFGNTPFAKSGAYKGKTHNGMDFRARTPQKVGVVLGGTVVRVNSNVAPNCQYGKWVVVEHENGLTTLYAHMSLVNVSAGQKLNTGDVVGYTGNSGYSTGPHLHLTTYASQAVKFKDYKCNSGITVSIPVAALNAYLNPLDYL